VGAALFQGEQIPAHGLADRSEFAAVTGSPGQGGKMNDAQKASAGKDPRDKFFGGCHATILKERGFFNSPFWTRQEN
jgi:hypothetical protein